MFSFIFTISTSYHSKQNLLLHALFSSISQMLSEQPVTKAISKNINKNLELFNAALGYTVMDSKKSK